jgi:hypothetical protein
MHEDQTFITENFINHPVIANAQFIKTREIAGQRYRPNEVEVFG